MLIQVPQGFGNNDPGYMTPGGSLNCSKASNHHMIHQKMDITSKPWLPIVTKLKRICRQGVSQIRSGTIQGSAAATRHPFSSPEKESAQDAIEMFRLFTLYSYSDTPVANEQRRTSLDNGIKKRMMVGGWARLPGGTGKAFLGVVRRVGLSSKIALTMSESGPRRQTANRLQCKLLVLESSCIH
jgi:hypothetical protein